MKLMVCDLSKTIKGKIILHNVNLCMSSGNVYGFVGRNGSGKTMLFRALSGLMKIDKGYVELDGKKLIAIDYIYTEYTNDNIEISYLSELCNMSESYFRRIFLKNYGISPIKYINNLKIERARELLTSGLYTVSDVAELSGFHDESYFSREFKKHSGKTPKEYANASLS